MELNIVVINCENNKKFLYLSDDSIFNLESSYNDYSCEFISKNKAIFVEKIIKIEDIFDLDKYVKYYMYNYGIDNVRGGSYSDNNLSSELVEFIKREFIFIDKNKKNNCEVEEIVHINNNYPKNVYKSPVKIQGYVYFTGCCVCGKNCIGRGDTYGCYNNIITSPKYKANNKIKELIVCGSCSKTIAGKKLLDTNSELYKVSEIVFNENM